MLNKNEELLIYYLNKKNDWIKSIEFSKILGVSQRMIRKYVKNINDNHEINYSIISSNKGYLIQQEISNEEQEIIVPDTKKDRIRFILYKLLTIKNSSIHLNKLADQLYVSEFTIENYIVDIKEYISEFQIELKRKRGFLSIEGSEKQKRYLMRKIMSEEIKATNFFGDKDVELDINIRKSEIQEIVRAESKKQKYFINEYMLNNISFHIMIAIYRLSEGNVIEKDNSTINYEQTLEYTIAKEIGKKIQSKTNILINDSEIYNIGLLLRGNISLINFDQLSLSEIEKELADGHAELLNSIIDLVYENYYVDLSNEEFKIQFLLHLKNLLLRTAKKQNSKNPLITDIKNSYPLVYDISVFISNELNKFFKIELSEDEIAYIALHVGTSLELQEREVKEINTLVICPKYYSIDQQIINKLKNHFGEEINIKRVITKENEIKYLDTNFDLIISTSSQIKALNTRNSTFIYVKPFLSDKDIEYIRKEISTIKQQKNKKELRSYLETYLPPTLFFKNIKLKDRKKVLDFLNQEFISKKIVDGNFLNEILKRESLSSTAFNNSIAMPHTINYNARKTKIGILMDEDSITWGDSNVQIVCIIAVNKEDNKFFGEFFQLLIEALSEIENVNKMLQTTTHQEFIDCVLDLMVV
ncbi:MAG: BglG family transcription antiterminator [Vagococcus fluvialis]